MGTVTNKSSSSTRQTTPKSHTATSTASSKLTFLSPASQKKLFSKQTAIIASVMVVVALLVVVFANAAGTRKSIALMFSSSNNATGTVLKQADGSYTFSKGTTGPTTPGTSIMLPNTTLGARINQFANDSEATVTQYLASNARGNFQASPAGPSTPNGQGQFRFSCQYSHFNYDDPIVYPGAQGRGKAHLHMYWGNTLTNAETTTTSLVNTGGGSCQGYEANRTAYWMPALLDANNKVVIPYEIIMYYKVPAELAAAAKEMPQGLKMIAGNASGNTDSSLFFANGIQWQCYTGSINYTYEGQTIPNTCPANTQANVTASGHGYSSADTFPIKLNAIIYFPTCLKLNGDGTPVLDSADHKSHAAYYTSNGRGGLKCPDTHPYVMPQVSYHVAWSGTENYTGWYLSSDRMGTVKPSGTTLHADWFGGWNSQVLKQWTQGCINQGQNCSNGTMTAAAGFPLRQLTRMPDYTGPTHLTVP